MKAWFAHENCVLYIWCMQLVQTLQVVLDAILRLVWTMMHTIKLGTQMYAMHKAWCVSVKNETDFCTMVCIAHMWNHRNTNLCLIFYTYALHTCGFLARAFASGDIRFEWRLNSCMFSYIICIIINPEFCFKLFWNQIALFSFWVPTYKENKFQQF